MNSRILKLDNIARGSAELSNLTRSLSVIDWTLQVQMIVKATGLPLSEMLSERETRVPPSSLAGRLGHEKLETFICGQSSDNGIGYDWAEWERNVTAYRYKSFYDIYVDDPAEVILQFEDVCNILGRMPASSAEYNMVKDSHLLAQKERLKERHELEKAELREQLQEAIARHSNSRSEIESARSAADEMKQRYEKLLSETQSKIDEAVRQKELEKADELQLIKADQQRKLEEEISFIKRNARLEVDEANERLEEEKRKIISNEYVAKHEYLAVQQQLDNERASVKEILVRLHKAEAMLESSQSNYTDKDAEIAKLNLIIEEQAGLIEELQNQIAQRSVSGKFYSEEEVSQMQARIEKLEYYLGRFRDGNNRWKARCAKSQGRLNKLNIKLIKAKRVIKSHEHLRQEHKDAKRNLQLCIFGFIVMGGTTAALAFLALAA